MTLSKILYSHQSMKILEFLFTEYEKEPGKDFSRMEIAKEAKIFVGTIDKMLPTLKHFGILTVSRKIGILEMYKLNMANPFVLNMLKAFNESIVLVRTLGPKPIEVKFRKRGSS